MEGHYPVPRIPDKAWNYLTDEQQDAHNQKVEVINEYNDAKDQYDTSMNLTGPTLVFVIGIIMGVIFSGFLILVAIIIAALWALVRIAARSHAYQRMKDAEVKMKSVLADLAAAQE
jgi:hypothetical protein